MFILLVFLYLKSGIIEVRHSEVTTLTSCLEDKPLFEKLYREGKFYDGPPKETIDHIKSRCEKI